MENRTKVLLSLSLVALFAALTAAGAFISIPLPFSPVPVVLQNMFTFLSGMLLGPIMGGAATAVYLMIGALGAPVFAGAKGGFAVLLGPTGGYLLGYLLAAITAGFIAGSPRREEGTNWVRIILAALAGILVIYIPGLLRLNMVMNGNWAKTLSAGFIPFIMGDLVKGAVACLITPRLRLLISDLYHA
jgi:biotin transport system substrate-specific component